MEMLPNYVTVKIFKSLHSVICKFVWKWKCSRLKLENLPLPLDRGGFAFPNIMYYRHILLHLLICEDRLNMIRSLTKEDKTLEILIKTMNQGWPNNKKMTPNETIIIIIIII